MKFENPIMNISVFSTEDIVTGSSGSNDPTVTSVKEMAENGKIGISGRNAEEILAITW